jgi:uncharacterized 2Fe-2S/4Fe-4S cluster protein (DUF4445 family)
MAILNIQSQDGPITSLVTDAAGAETVLDAIQRAGLGAWLNAECGGIGNCGQCRVRVVGPAPDPTSAELEMLDEPELDAGLRLACQLQPDHDLTIELAAPAMLRRAKADLAGEVTVAASPVVRKQAVSLAPPSLEDQHSDWQRLCRALDVQVDGQRPASPPLRLLYSLPSALREAAFTVTGVFHGADLIAVEPGDTTRTQLAAAVDIGTTTLAAYLLDLNAGRAIGVAAGANPQRGYGADVISRISAVAGNPASLPEMQRLVVAAINDLLAEAAAGAGVSRDGIYELVVAGNPCMLHLFAGVNPRHLAGTPYIPAFSELIVLDAAALGLQLNPAARVCLLPGISGYVGADIVADILATRLHHLAGTRLLIDVGTNGEMVLARDGRLITCATAAGPAFEGAHIACGMRAAVGAIEHVSVDGRFDLTVIGTHTEPVEPAGLCGSGLLDAVAAMVRAGVVDASGRMQNAANLPAAVGSRLFARNGSTAFRLGGPPDRPVFVSQHDVRQVQMAKGAINSGISILLGEFGLTHADLDEVLLAGAFGSYLSPESALITGLLPPVPLARVRAVGNTAGDGARLVTLSSAARAEAVEIARTAAYIELSARKDFQSIFLKAIAFPSVP